MNQKQTTAVIDRFGWIKALCKSPEDAAAFVVAAVKGGENSALDWTVRPIQVMPAEWTPDQTMSPTELVALQEEAAHWRALTAALHRHGFDRTLTGGVGGLVKLIESAAKDTSAERSAAVERLAETAPIPFEVAARTFLPETATAPREVVLRDPTERSAFFKFWAGLRHEWALEMVSARKATTA